MPKDLTEDRNRGLSGSMEISDETGVDDDVDERVERFRRAGTGRGRRRGVALQDRPRGVVQRRSCRVIKLGARHVVVLGLDER